MVHDDEGMDIDQEEMSMETKENEAPAVEEVAEVALNTVVP